MFSKYKHFIKLRYGWRIVLLMSGQANKGVSQMDSSDPLVILVVDRIDSLLTLAGDARTYADAGDLEGARRCMLDVADKSMALASTIRTIGDK